MTTPKQEGEKMREKELHEEAMMIEHQAWELVEAFDDAAEGKDRRVAYTALIMIMASFAKSSSVSAEQIMSDFAQRIFAGVDVKSERPS